MKKLASLIRVVGIALVSAAIAQELRKPPQERTWEGTVAGVVPYDFRMPTLERLRDAYWNPENPRVFTNRAFGVGWGINVPTLYRRLKEIYEGCCGAK